MTTTASVTSPRIRLSARAAVTHLCDVRLLADDLEVTSRSRHLLPRAITTLGTTAARMAIEHIYTLPADAVTVEFQADAITLSGWVSSAGDRLAVEIAIDYLADHHRVTNQILVAGRFVEDLAPTPSFPTIQWRFHHER